jgi:hypothetical protein
MKMTDFRFLFGVACGDRTPEQRTEQLHGLIKLTDQHDLDLALIETNHEGQNIILISTNNLVDHYKMRVLVEGDENKPAGLALSFNFLQSSNETARTALVSAIEQFADAQAITCMVARNATSVTCSFDHLSAMGSVHVALADGTINKIIKQIEQRPTLPSAINQTNVSISANSMH